MKNRKQLFMTSRLLLIIVAVALVLSMGLTACGLPSGTPNGKTPDVVDSVNAGSGEDQTTQSLTTTSRVNLDETYGELLPLYETLTEQESSAYSLAFNLTGVVNTADISGAIDLRYVVTVDDDGAISMMFLDENDNVLFSYKDGKISLDGFGMDIGFYQYNLEVDQLPSYPPDAAGCIMDILAFLNGFLSDYDDLALLLPSIIDSMGFDTTGIVMTSQNGEYVFNANCQPLLILASAYLSDSFDDLLASLPFEIDIAELLGVGNTEASDLELLIAAVDNMFFNGALSNGYIDLNAHLTITEKGLNVSVALVSAVDHTQQYLYLEAGARIEDVIPIEVPEVTTLHDIQADIPISLPRTGIDMIIHAIFHTADIFAEEGKDFITATVDLNGLEDVASLVLNDNYLYVDINELVMITNPLVGETTDYTYVFNFGSEKQVHTILRDISRLLDGIMEDIGFYDEYDDDNFLQLDLVVMDDINENMTEAELREKLYVSAVYNNRIPEELFDYRLAGCGCCPSHDKWVMVYYDYHDRYAIWENYDYPHTVPNTLNVSWRSREIYQGMSESALRETLTVNNGFQEIHDYVIDDFYVCPYCGIYHIAVSYDGLSFSRYSRVLDCSGTYNHIGDGTGTNYIGNSYSHQLLVEENIDPNEYICHGVIYDPKSFYNGITESEAHDLIHLVKITYGNPPEEIPDFEIEDIDVTGNRLYFRIFHWDYDENNVPVSGYGFSIDATIYDSSVVSPLLPYLRFEVSPAQEPIDAISEVIGGLIGTYLENQDLLGEIFQVEDIENGKNITVCLSDTSLVEEGDLLAFVNKFFGLPGEDGFVDLNGQTLYYFLSEALGEDGVDALEAVGGFTLEDLCTDLYLNVTGYLNNNNKLRFGFSLSGADTDPEVDETYLSIGIIEYHAVVTDSAYDANLTAEELAAANPLDEIVDVLFGCLASLMSMGGDLE